MGTNHFPTTTYHLQTYIDAERIDKQLSAKRRNYVAENHWDWASYVPPLAYVEAFDKKSPKAESYNSENF